MRVWPTVVDGEVLADRFVASRGQKNSAPMIKTAAAMAAKSRGRHQSMSLKPSVSILSERAIGLSWSNASRVMTFSPGFGGSRFAGLAPA